MAMVGRSGRRWLAALLAAVLALAGLPWATPHPAGAANCAVTSTANGGAGSLREKLADGNCDSITFQAGLGAVTLASRLVVTRTVTIDGAGQVVQYGGAAAPDGSVFWVQAGTVVLRGLTIQGGRTAGIWGAGLTINGGNVTLDGVTVRDNIAANAGGGGIYVTDATLRLTNTVVEGNVANGDVAAEGRGGGGLFVDDYYGTVAVTIEGGSRIVGNRAIGNRGGGIYVWDRAAGNAATLTLTDSTLGSIASPNEASVVGGGLYNLAGAVTLTGATIGGNTTLGNGGGIYNHGGVATLTNATLSGNTAGNSGGGLFNFGGATTVRFVTVVGNVADSNNDGGGSGGGIIGSIGTVTALSSIVVGNRTGPGAPSDCAAAITSQGRNVWGDQVACPNNASLGDRNLAVLNLSVAAVLNPALADNGGPTHTHALVAGSPAIDHGDNVTCADAMPGGAGARDQRGVARPQGGGCDSGAVEGIAAPPAQTMLTVASGGGGTVGRSPAGTGGGPYSYAPGTPVALTPQPESGQVFVGWVVDGAYRGWAASLTLTMDTAHAVQAMFAPTSGFPDVGGGRADHAAIVALATRGTIRGYANGTYGPDDTVQRAQMAALIARATPGGPGTPPGTLTPPACLAAGTWDCEDWGNTFQDRQGLDVNLWRNVGALQHYRVAFGYDGDACKKRGVASPCYAPTAPVSYVETVTFITRAMIAKGYWQAQPGAAQPYAGVPAVFAAEVATFTYYAGDIPAPPGDWNAGATRGWFARALWAALNSYWGTDWPLADGRTAGGMAP